MNQELELQLQSYVDGELSGRDARRLESWIAGDKEAQMLLAELKMAKTVLTGNEPERPVPESREFYWGKIQRQIQHVEPPPAERAWAVLFAWRKFLAPLAGVALVMFLAIGTLKYVTGVDDPVRHLAEVENLSEHTGSFSFRSHSDNMFVVWIYDKNLNAEPEPEVSDNDEIIQ